ncbi:hypothetical protein ROS217_14366 [Roseovarius sp. 217]|nr:hypothetical protein ROS217_14366 [Roseovarius sp. 217]
MVADQRSFEPSFSKKSINFLKVLTVRYFHKLCRFPTFHVRKKVIFIKLQKNTGVSVCSQGVIVSFLRFKSRQIRNFELPVSLPNHFVVFDSYRTVNRKSHNRMKMIRNRSPCTFDKNLKIPVLSISLGVSLVTLRNRLTVIDVDLKADAQFIFGGRILPEIPAKMRLFDVFFAIRNRP